MNLRNQPVDPKTNLENYIEKKIRNINLINSKMNLGLHKNYLNEELRLPLEFFESHIKIKEKIEEIVEEKLTWAEFDWLYYTTYKVLCSHVTNNCMNLSKKDRLEVYINADKTIWSLFDVKMTDIDESIIRKFYTKVLSLDKENQEKLSIEAIQNRIEKAINMHKIGNAGTSQIKYDNTSGYYIQQ